MCVFKVKCEVLESTRGQCGQNVRPTLIFFIVFFRFSDYRRISCLSLIFSGDCLVSFPFRTFSFRFMVSFFHSFFHLIVIVVFFFHPKLY